MSNRFFVERIDRLKLHVYTIGYPEKGESQIVVLLDSLDNSVLLSCVIDCYSHNEANQTLEILRAYNIKTLDFFIWTHTDEDHSLGIDNLIDEFCNGTTQFFLPEGVTGNEKDFIEYNQEIKECFKRINDFNKGQNYNVHTISAVPGGHQVILRKSYMDKSSKELVVEVLGVAPMSALIRRRWETGIARKKNDLSIATIFKFGEISLFFSGDIENQTIKHIPEFYFEGLSYVKTPHHTSKSSSMMIEKIESSLNGDKLPSAVTTTYKAHTLPDEDILKLYKKNSECVSSTGTGEHDYGYVKTVFDVIDLHIEEETLHGNAFLV